MEQFNIAKVIEFVKPKIIPGIHGINHSIQVERNAIILSRFANYCVNENIIRSFAYLHDSCRVNNAYDAKHGERAAQLVESIKNDILVGMSAEDISLLKLACQLHTDVLCSCLPSVDVCFDADRLDLVRCGIMPDASKMATSMGAYFANNFEKFKQYRNDFFPKYN